MEQKLQTWRPSPSCLYALGFIGATVHFVSHATSLWTGVVGFLKAIVWPAILVYEALEQLTL